MNEEVPRDDVELGRENGKSLDSVGVFMLKFKR